MAAALLAQTPSVALTDARPHDIWEHEIAQSLPEPSLRRLALLSLATILFGFGGAIFWASRARLDSAVPAPGVVVASGKRKTVSLLEPGILRELAVHEGDYVRAGDVLLRLDDVQARTVREQAYAAYWAAIARASRLHAELLDRRELAFPAALLAEAGNQSVAAALEAERHLFETRWETFDSTVRIAQRRIAQQQASTAALEAQLAAYRTRLALTRDELQGVEFLLARGFATKPHWLELRRNEAELQGTIGDLTGKIAEAKQLVAQTEQEIVNSANTRRSEISKDRTDTLATIADTAQRLRGAEDTLTKQVVAAPEPGIVTDIKFVTPGGSIGAGQPILDIVPEDDPLLIEASVSPNDIEHVQVGQSVNIRLTAYKAHKVPVLPGHLVYVAADRKTDERNEPIFVVRAALEPDALGHLPDVRLYAGMPADVLVIGGERTVLDFLLAPIRDNLRHAMRED